MAYEVGNLVNLRHPVFVMPNTLENRIRRMHLPSRERAMVSELTQVMRRYPDQAPAKWAELMKVAFTVITVGGGVTREQKLAQAHVRGLEVRQNLLEAEGGSWSSEEVARLLRISKTAVLKRLAAGRLLAWLEERLQAARFPRWQFDAHSQVLDGLEDVLAILNRDARFVSLALCGLQFVGLSMGIFWRRCLRWQAGDRGRQVEWLPPQPD